MDNGKTICDTPEETFAFGEQLAETLRSGDVLLLYGGLGAGKTLLTKGILNALYFDIDEVTSPSFSLVNLYKTSRYDVSHIDLWRLDGGADPAEAVGLDEILENENAITIIEWADRLRDPALLKGAISIKIEGNGDEPRSIIVQNVDVSSKI